MCTQHALPHISGCIDKVVHSKRNAQPGRHGVLHYEHLDRRQRGRSCMVRPPHVLTHCPLRCMDKDVHSLSFPDCYPYLHLIPHAWEALNTIHAWRGKGRGGGGHE
jgi:hypothetical protein